MADPRKKFRQMVSLSKRRFQDKELGLDLDLTYITSNIIAFGFPSEGKEKMYRNPMEECQRCIEKERQYKSSKFQGRVAKFQWADHNAPPLEMIERFCEHAMKWLIKDPLNVVAVHCKAGKGRTGVMICSLLLYLNICQTIDEAMIFYGRQRTYNGKGVTIPSQIRFIRYYEIVLNNNINLDTKFTPRFLKSVTLHSISNFEDHYFAISIQSNGSIQYRKKGDSSFIYWNNDDSICLDVENIPISGNVKIIIFKPGKKREELCHFWFHTIFLPENEIKLTKKEIDGAIADREHKIFSPDFSISVQLHEDLIGGKSFAHLTNKDNNDSMKIMMMRSQIKSNTHILNHKDDLDQQSDVGEYGDYDEYDDDDDDDQISDFDNDITTFSGLKTSSNNNLSISKNNINGNNNNNTANNSIYLSLNYNSKKEEDVANVKNVPNSDDINIKYHSNNFLTPISPRRNGNLNSSLKPYASLRNYNSKNNSFINNSKNNLSSTTPNNNNNNNYFVSNFINNNVNITPPRSPIIGSTRVLDLASKYESKINEHLSVPSLSRHRSSSNSINSNNTNINNDSNNSNINEENTKNNTETTNDNHKNDNLDELNPPSITINNANIININNIYKKSEPTFSLPLSSPSPSWKRKKKPTIEKEAFPPPPSYPAPPCPTSSTE